MPSGYDNELNGSGPRATIFAVVAMLGVAVAGYVVIYHRWW